MAASAVLFGSNTSCEQAGAEVGPHHALAGRGEQHLLDQVADVVGVAGRRGAAAAVEVVGEVERRHARPLQVASTRVCATTGSIGVPVGAQTDWPIMRRDRRAAGEHARGAHDELAGDARRRRRAGRARSRRSRTGAASVTTGCADTVHARERRESASPGRRASRARWRRDGGRDRASRASSDDRQRAEVDVGRRAGHVDDRALAVAR